jgi:protein-disulfide isomerase
MSASAGGKLVPPVGERDHAQGPADAEVTLVEYGDYECPFCGRAHPVVKELQRRMADRLRYVFRHFPLGQIHPHAEHAAQAAEAAAAQGQFWPMHDTLFEHQRELADEQLIARAEELGLDTNRFERELREGVYAERVRADFLSGIRSGVNGTPTFFINGVRHDASWAVETLLSALEEAAASGVRS